MCTPPLSPFLQRGGWGFEPRTKFSKGVGGGDLTGPHLLERVVGKEGSNFFQRVVKGGGGGFQFSHKEKKKNCNI